MGLIFRNVVNRPLTWTEGDANFSYLLTNMSGSNISITGSTVGILSSGNIAIKSNSNITVTGTTIITGSLNVTGSNANINAGSLIVTSSNITPTINGYQQGGVYSNFLNLIGTKNSPGKGNIAASQVSATNLNVGINGDGFYNSTNITEVGDYAPYGNGTLFTVDDNQQIFSFQSSISGITSYISASNGSVLFDSGKITSNGSGRLTTKGGLTVTGSLLVTGSATINNLLTLTLQSTTPASGFTTGSVIVSGSGANVHMYFYNGTAWKQLDN